MLHLVGYTYTHICQKYVQNEDFLKYSACSSVPLSFSPSWKLTEIKKYWRHKHYSSLERRTVGIFCLCFRASQFYFVTTTNEMQL